MIELNEDITARAVARRHPTLAHASTITRNPVRAALLAKYQAKQKELRNWQWRFKDRSYTHVAAELARKDQRIAELERQVEMLKASHRAMIQAVDELARLPQVDPDFIEFPGLDTPKYLINRGGGWRKRL